MASKKYSFFLTETAESDINQIFEYISVNLSNPEAAASFADELESQISEICKTPKIGRLVENGYIKRSDVRRILIETFILYYLIDDREHRIIVLRVVYSKRDQNKIFKSL